MRFIPRIKPGWGCICTSSFHGRNCSTPRHECLPETKAFCLNGGSCILRSATKTVLRRKKEEGEEEQKVCICSEDFEGDRCQRRKDEAESPWEPFRKDGRLPIF